MGKYSNFLKTYTVSHGFEKVNGSYGCQTCSVEVLEALFDKDKGIMFWICPQEHRSEIKVGV
jgi:hypothetical protein